jgi:hypothetical protein
MLICFLNGSSRQSSTQWSCAPQRTQRPSDLYCARRAGDTDRARDPVGELVDRGADRGVVDRGVDRGLVDRGVDRGLGMSIALIPIALISIGSSLLPLPLPLPKDCTVEGDRPDSR